MVLEMRGWRLSLPGAALDVHILSAARTPLGAFGGALRALGTTNLAAQAARGALARAGCDPAEVDGLMLGQVLQAGAGLNPAARAAREAGLPGLPALTVNQGGASGLQAVALGAQALQNGDGATLLTGGMESASGAPYLLPAARWGRRLGAAQLLDALLLDGYGIGRAGAFPEDGSANGSEGLDLGRVARANWAEESRRRAADARAAGTFAREIVPVKVSGRGTMNWVETDETLGSPGDPGGLPAAVTDAAPADGAALLLLGRARPGRRPLARILGFAQAPGGFGTAGTGALEAIRRLLAQTGLRPGEIDCWELDECKAQDLLAVMTQVPEVDPRRVNPRGGALALGNALGAEGARRVVSLLQSLADAEGRYGLAAAGTEGGAGLALAVERLG